MRTRYKTIIAAASLLFTVGAVVYAAEVFTYKCSKCGLILSFDKSQGGDYTKCPKDGQQMVRQKK